MKSLGYYLGLPWQEEQRTYPLKLQTSIIHIGLHLINLELESFTLTISLNLAESNMINIQKIFDSWNFEQKNPNKLFNKIILDTRIYEGSQQIRSSFSTGV